MSAVAIPNKLEQNYKKLTSNTVCRKKLNAFLRSPTFSEALLNHRRQFNNVSDKEYRVTLEALLDHYAPGELVGIKQLVKNTISELDNRFKDRRLSQNEITTSFAGLLRDTGIITGDAVLKWAWLDTPSLSDRCQAITRNIYTAYIAQTEEEANLKKEYRNATALREKHNVVLSNRSLLDDISQQLEIISKMDKRCRDKAMELNIPYSQVRAQTMKTRSGNSINLKSLIFPTLVAAVVLTGVLLSADNTTQPVNPYTNLDETVVSDIDPQYGLTVAENIWRTQYIQLHKQYGSASNAIMEESLFALAAQYMIPHARMKDIVKTIRPQEVQ